MFEFLNILAYVMYFFWLMNWWCWNKDYLSIYSVFPVICYIKHVRCKIHTVPEEGILRCVGFCWFWIWDSATLFNGYRQLLSILTYFVTFYFIFTSFQTAFYSKVCFAVCFGIQIYVQLRVRRNLKFKGSVGDCVLFPVPFSAYSDSLLVTLTERAHVRHNNERQSTLRIAFIWQDWLK